MFALNTSKGDLKVRERRLKTCIGVRLVVGSLSMSCELERSRSRSRGDSPIAYAKRVKREEEDQEATHRNPENSGSENESERTAKMRNAKASGVLRLSDANACPTDVRLVCCLPSGVVLTDDLGWHAEASESGHEKNTKHTEQCADIQGLRSGYGMPQNRQRLIQGLRSGKQGMPQNRQRRI